VKLEQSRTQLTAQNKIDDIRWLTWIVDGDFKLIGEIHTANEEI
jgi:hypothetical protein